MTRTEAIARIQSALPALSAEQAEALAELATALTRPVSDEDDATRAAIAEGVAQADRGEFVEAGRADAVLRRPWK